MEWVLVIIAYLVLSKLRLITIEFANKPQDPPSIEEPHVDRKKLDE